MDSELIKIEKLQNNSQWSRLKFQIKVLLNASDLFDVVNGDFKKPVPGPVAGKTTDALKAYKENNDLLFKEWKKADCKAQKIVLTTIGENALLHIMNCETSRDMWIKLHAVYEQKTECSVHLLQQKFFRASHISKLEELAQRLRELNEPVSESMLIT